MVHFCAAAPVHIPAAVDNKGARFANAFAFAPHDGTLAGHDKARDGWLAKNVTPILYDSREGHRLAGETLIEWARIRSDPIQLRPQIALNGIREGLIKSRVP